MKHVNPFLVLLKLPIFFIIPILFIILVLHINSTQTNSNNLLLFLMHLSTWIYNHIHRVQHQRRLSIQTMVQHRRHPQIITRQNHHLHHQLIHYIHNRHLLITLPNILQHLRHQLFQTAML